MVAETDAMLGQVLDTSKPPASSTDTYIHLRQRPRRNEHGTPPNPQKRPLRSLRPRPPLIVAGPGLRQGVTSDQNSSPSSTSSPPSWTSPAWSTRKASTATPSCPSAAATPQAVPNYVFSEYHSNFANTGIAMWRQGPWKYIRYAGYAPQLFNLDDDPEELTNLAQNPPRQ